MNREIIHGNVRATESRDVVTEITPGREPA